MPRELNDRDCREGFWYYRPEEGSPPPVIRHPEQYENSASANISCTQTNLPRAQQANLVRNWCETLPRLAALELVWFSSKVPQELFDAACRIPNLRGLYVKWSSIKRLDALSHCRHLRFLRLGSSPQIESIEPLSKLATFDWLELEDFKRIRDLAPLAELHELIGLTVEGSMWSTQIVDSLAPIGRLARLRYLCLANLKSKDKTLAPLYSLEKLELFHSASWWDENEIRELRARNPKLRQAGR
jgi:hypothetical protein